MALFLKKSENCSKLTG